jgi:hypothetical protein
MLCQHLHCDDGSMLGLVEDGPTYWGNELARRIIRRRGVLPGTRRRRAPLSKVMRYHEDAPTYAWVRVSAPKDGGSFCL